MVLRRQPAPVALLLALSGPAAQGTHGGHRDTGVRPPGRPSHPLGRSCRAPLQRRLVAEARVPPRALTLVKAAEERPTTRGMDWILRSRWGSNLLLIAASAVVPAAGVHFLMNEGRAPISGTGHLLIMAVGASVAAVASIALMARGLRSRDGRAAPVPADRATRRPHLRPDTADDRPDRRRRRGLHEDALVLLRDGVGTLFDGRCVAELELLTAGTTRHVPATPGPRTRLRFRHPGTPRRPMTAVARPTGGPLSGRRVKPRSSPSSDSTAPASTTTTASDCPSFARSLSPTTPRSPRAGGRRVASR